MPLSKSEFPAFYRAHFRRVLLFFARRTLDPEVARDLAAETFAKAFESRARVRGTSADELVAWLFGIARHELSHFYRRGRARRAAIERLGIQLPAVSHDDAERILELAGSQVLRAALAEAVGSLKEHERDALQLRVVDERPYSEVAQRLGVTEGTARTRVARALRRLNERLGADVSTEGTG